MGSDGEQVRNQRTSLLAVMAHSAAEALFQISALVWAFQSGGTARAGTTALTGLALAAAATPFASMLIGRYGAVRIYRLGAVAQTVCLAVVSWVLVANAAVPLIVAATSAVYMVLTFTRLAHYSLLPTMLDDPRKLISLTRDSRVAELTGIVSGPLLAAAALALSGPSLAMGTAAVCTGISALLVAGIRTPERTLEQHALRTLTSDSGPLFTQLRKEPGALGVIGLGLLHYIVIGSRGVLFITMTFDKSGSTSLAGIVTACFSVGAFIATLVGSRRLPPAVFPWMLGGAFAFVGSMVFMAKTPNIVFMGGAALAGAALATIETGNRTMLPRSLPSHLLGRVYAVQETMQMVGMAIGSICAPFLIETLGIVPAVAVIGSLPLLVVAALQVRLRLLDWRGIERTEAITLVAESDLFEGAPPGVVSALAFAMERVCYDAGSVVVRQHDHGDTLYMIASGSADVSVNGQHVRRLAAGEYFGEVALIAARPRTATIVAAEPVALWELKSGPFLTAVTCTNNDVDMIVTGRGRYLDLI